jgi:uncharacterized protein with PIN domain
MIGDTCGVVAMLFGKAAAPALLGRVGDDGERLMSV